MGSAPSVQLGLGAIPSFAGLGLASEVETISETIDFFSLRRTRR